MLNVTVLGELHTPPQLLVGKTVIVCGPENTPVAIVHEASAGATLVYTVKDPEFTKMLQQLGLGRIVITNTAPGPRLPGETVSKEALARQLERITT